ncbi:hypothetical protein VTI74DRAFT_9879 [Chaetomium olivicolor]
MLRVEGTRSDTKRKENGSWDLGEQGKSICRRGRSLGGAPRAHGGVINALVLTCTAVMVRHNSTVFVDRGPDPCPWERSERMGRSSTLYIEDMYGRVICFLGY